MKKLPLIVDVRSTDVNPLGGFSQKSYVIDNYGDISNYGLVYHNWRSDRSLPSPYPRPIASIAIEARIHPSLMCRLVHRSGYLVPGSFTPIEAAEILARSRDWDWTTDEKRRPACRGKLLALLEQVAGTDSGARPVRAIGEVGNV